MKNAKHGKVLVSGMGSSFGLLYSAVYHVKPDIVLVITSDKFRNAVAEACDKAGFSDMGRIHVFTMSDVFAGFNETPALLQQMWPQIKEAEKIIINLTGGTTAMQWVMQSAYEEAAKNHLPVERVAFVDRRTAVEQQQNPWQLGELLEIEKLRKIS
ncbi:MAG TPA: hypothetical protein PKI71_16040 [Candidatus Rifleibacterium sp.]|nr:hypothetical protein [Candidatus Rifleibacterium sp.]